MMKTFASYLTVIAVSCAFLLVRSNAIVTDNSNSIVMESSRKNNLRGAVRIQQPHDGSLNSFIRYRRTEEGTDEEKTEKTIGTLSSKSEGKDAAGNEKEELKNIEKEFGNEDKVSEKETEELENTENEFGGDSNEKTATTSEEKTSTFTSESIGSNDTGKEVGKAETLFTIQPTAVPVAAPTAVPVAAPTVVPVAAPTVVPFAAPTTAPVVPPYEEIFPPTDKPTSKYNAIQDEYDPIKAEDEKEELESELKQEEKVARRAGGLGIFFGVIAMIFTAHQMSENPDGIYASVCRLAITISSVVIKIVCMPCRKLIGGGNGNPYSGHMPISTSDYNYRNDPYRSNANAGFEMK